MPGLAIGLAVLLCELATPASADPGQVTLTPASGPTGTTVTITGDACHKAGPGPSTVSVRAPTLGVDLSIEADNNGSWSGTFLVPSDAIEGPHDITVTCIRNLVPLAYPSAAFSVIPPPATTGPPTSSVDTTPAPTTAPPPATGAGAAATQPSPGSVPTSTSGTLPSGAPVDTALTETTASERTTSTSGATSGAETASTGGDGRASSSVAPRRDGGAPPTTAALDAPAAARDGRATQLVLIGLAMAVLASVWLAMRSSHRARRSPGEEPDRLASQEAGAGIPMAGGLSSSTAAHDEDESAANRLECVAETSVHHPHPPRPRITGTPVDIGPAVRALEPRVRDAVGANISLQFDIGAEPCVALLGPDHLAQMLLPLVENAAEALEDGGVLRIATGRGQRAESTREDTSVDSALIVVADTGPGIPSDILGDLLEGFSSTSDNVSELSGLAAVHRVVTDLGGQLDVSSVPGHGTTVTVALPIYDAPGPIVVLDDEGATVIRSSQGTPLVNRRAPLPPVRGATPGAHAP